jgi:hypothetical protein
MIWYMIYLLTAVGLTPGGSSTVHIYTKQYTERQKKQTIHRTTQKNTLKNNTLKASPEENLVRKLEQNIFFFIVKLTECINFPNLFWLKNEPLHVSDRSSAHHQDFTHFTLGTGMSYRFEDSFRTGSGWNCSSILILWEISASVGFIIKKFVTLHGHMNINNKICLILVEKHNNFTWAIWP